MAAITQLRLARLRRGWTMDDLFLRSRGKLSPARLSRIERGISTPSAEEAQLLMALLGVTSETVVESGIASQSLAAESLAPPVSAAALKNLKFRQA